MKSLTSIFLLLAAAGLPLFAHDHIEVGRNPASSGQMFLSGPTDQVALFVPVGEPFSSYLPTFPGGTYANELTFTTEVNAIPFADGSLPSVEVLAVEGPAGGAMSFWESGADQPTWTRPSGWSVGGADRRTIRVYEDGTGYGHIHGRAFTFSGSGTYRVTLRAIDDAGLRAPSSPIVVTFQVLNPPQLSISIVGDHIRLQFPSRSGMVYDVQRSTDLTATGWTTIGNPLDGDGRILEFTDSSTRGPRVFYRLVEYR